jgi:hypothetical protein
MTDNVNHPKHYAQHPSGVAVILTAPTKEKDQHQQPCPCAWCKVEEENKEMAKENP